MAATDYVVVAVYLTAITLFGSWFARYQKTTRDYFLADRSSPWWAICFTIVATETSTLSFIGVPAQSYGGSMVFLSSVQSRLGAAGEYVWYAATKSGVDGLVTGLSKELAGEGIRVNIVSPGPIDTEIHEPGRLARIAPQLPTGRVGTPQEVAEAILFLMSDAASYTSGTTLTVSGAR